MPSTCIYIPIRSNIEPNVNDLVSPLEATVRVKPAGSVTERALGGLRKQKSITDKLATSFFLFY